MPTKTGVWVLVKKPRNQERASGVFLTLLLGFLASLFNCLLCLDRYAPEQRYCELNPFDRSHPAGSFTRRFAKSRGKWLNLRAAGS
jgi:hypothetical protein